MCEIKGLVNGKECSVVEACFEHEFTCGNELSPQAIDCLRSNEDIGIVREIEGALVVYNLTCPTSDVDNVIPIVYNNKLYCVELDRSRWECNEELAVQYVKSLESGDSTSDGNEDNQEGSQGEEENSNESGESNGGNNEEEGNGNSQGENNSSGGSGDGTSQGNESGSQGGNNEQKQEIVFKMADWLSMDIMGIPLWMWLAGLGLLLIFL
jgi:hypothetical protein